MKSVYTFLLALLMNITGVAFAFAPTLKTTMTTTSLFMSDGEKQTGTVKWFNTMKGYGFIVPDGDGPDLFVHQTEIQASGFRSLADGEAVEFTPVEDGNGRIKATAVTGPGGADVQGAPFRENDSYDSY